MPKTEIEYRINKLDAEVEALRAALTVAVSESGHQRHVREALNTAIKEWDGEEDALEALENIRDMVAGIPLVKKL